MNYGQWYEGMWLKCPECGNDTELFLETYGVMNVQQNPASGLRRESEFVIADDRESDSIGCKQCNYFAPYEQFMTLPNPRWRREKRNGHSIPPG